MISTVLCGRFYKIFVSPMLHRKRTAAAVLFSCSKLFSPPPLRGCPQGRHPHGPPGRGMSRPKASESSDLYALSLVQDPRSPPSPSQPENRRAGRCA